MKLIRREAERLLPRLPELSVGKIEAELLLLARDL